MSLPLLYADETLGNGCVDIFRFSLYRLTLPNVTPSLVCRRNPTNECMDNFRFLLYTLALRDVTPSLVCRWNPTERMCGQLSVLSLHLNPPRCHSLSCIPPEPYGTDVWTSFRFLLYTFITLRDVTPSLVCRQYPRERDVLGLSIPSLLSRFPLVCHKFFTLKQSTEEFRPHARMHHVVTIVVVAILVFVLFHNFTSYTNYLLLRIHTNIAGLLIIMCTLVATCVMLGTLECIRSGSILETTIVWLIMFLNSWIWTGYLSNSIGLFVTTRNGLIGAGDN